VPVAQYVLKGLGLDSRLEQKICYPKTARNVSGANPDSYYKGTGVFFSGVSGRDIMLTSHLRQVLRLRMSGGKPLLILNVVIACAGTILLLHFLSHT